MKISADNIRSVIKEADVDQKGTDFANDVPLREQGLDSLDTFTIYLAIWIKTFKIIKVRIKRKKI